MVHDETSGPVGRNEVRARLGCEATKWTDRWVIAMSAPSAVAESHVPSPKHASRGLRWAGVPAALTTVTLGAAAFIGLDVPLTRHCTPHVHGEGGCSIDSGTLPLQWVLPLALVGAVVLLLPAGVLTVRADRRLSVWFWLGVCAVAVTGLVPLVLAAMLARGEHLYADLAADNVALYIFAGTAVAETVLIGVAVLAERALPVGNRGLVAATALAGVAGLCLVTATALTALGLALPLLPVLLLLATALAAVVVRLRRGRPGLARATLWLLLILPAGLGAIAALGSLAVLGSEGLGYQVTLAVVFGGPPLAVAGLALTGLLAGVHPPLVDGPET